MSDNQDPRRANTTESPDDSSDHETALQSLIEQIDEHTSQLTEEDSHQDRPASTTDNKPKKNKIKKNKIKKNKKTANHEAGHSHTMLYSSLLVMTVSMAGLGFMWYQSQLQITEIQAEIKDTKRQIKSMKSVLEEKKQQTVSPTIPMTELLGRVTTESKEKEAGKSVKHRPAQPKAVKRIEKHSAPKPQPRRSTTWSIVISSHENIQEARQRQRELSALGIQCSMTDSIIRGQKWYRIETGNWPTANKAKVQLHILQKKTNVPDLWIKKNPGSV